jgi:cell division protein FtsL
VAPQSQRRRIPFLLLALAVITAMVVGLVSAQTLVAQGSFRLQALSKEADRLEAEFGRLRLRADRLSSLDRIERAGRRVGMEYASPFLLTVPRPHAADGTPGAAPGVTGAAQTKAALGAGG